MADSGLGRLFLGFCSLLILHVLSQETIASSEALDSKDGYFLWLLLLSLHGQLHLFDILASGGAGQLRREAPLIENGSYRRLVALLIRRLILLFGGPSNHVPESRINRLIGQVLDSHIETRQRSLERVLYLLLRIIDLFDGSHHLLLVQQRRGSLQLSALAHQRRLDHGGHFLLRVALVDKGEILVLVVYVLDVGKRLIGDVIKHFEPGML